MNVIIAWYRPVGLPEKKIILCNVFTDNNVTVDTSCGNGDVRLVGGANELEGRVEICYNKMWGSVCHQNWQINDANVVCKQLHFQPTGKKLRQLKIIIFKALSRGF